ncbi:MAG: hypothetical protein PVS2B2_16570 [Candidatus Acidiferrum sp.]
MHQRKNAAIKYVSFSRGIGDRGYAITVPAKSQRAAKESYERRGREVPRATNY